MDITVVLVLVLAALAAAIGYMLGRENKDDTNHSKLVAEDIERLAEKAGKYEAKVISFIKHRNTTKPKSDK